MIISSHDAFFYVFSGVLLVIGGIVLFCVAMNKRLLRKKLIDLNSCPFKFSVDEDRIYFHFPTAKLYCTYDFGIRKDGTYGLKEIGITGVNQGYGGSIPLKIGQNIFPIIESMKRFENWASAQKFDYYWGNSLRKYWQNTIQNLDNLDYLEYKYKENHK